MKKISRIATLAFLYFTFIVLIAPYTANSDTTASNIGLTPQPLEIDEPINLPTQQTGPGGVTPSIVGGQPASRDRYPWMSYLSSRSSGRSGFCGASLIADTWVLTAAHCISSQVRFVVVGVYDRREAQPSNVFEVDDIFVHPGYRNVTSGFDIALIKLERPVPTSLVKNYAQLPSIPLNNERVGAGDSLDAIGWGATAERGRGSPILLQVSVPVVSSASCNRAYTVDYDSQVCAGLPRGGKDSCQGDSGGPLLFARDGQDYVAGIVSYGRGCARPNLPGVYTRTSAYLDWVGSFIVDSDPGPGGNQGGSSTETNLSAAAGAWTQTFRIDIPAGTSTLDVNINGQNGDADLYVYFAQAPSVTVNSPIKTSTRCVPWIEGSIESCSFTDPRPGSWFIRIHGFNAFSGVTLQTQYAP